MDRPSPVKTFIEALTGVGGFLIALAGAVSAYRSKQRKAKQAAANRSGTVRNSDAETIFSEGNKIRQWVTEQWEKLQEDYAALEQRYQDCQTTTNKLQREFDMQAAEIRDLHARLDRLGGTGS